MLNLVSGSVPGTVVVNHGNIPVEDIQDYSKYIAVLRNLGQLKKNESPLVDMKAKTLVADKRYAQWIRRKITGGFDSKIIEEAFDFLRKCHKKACTGRTEYREWSEEIIKEMEIVGIDKDFNYHTLKKATKPDQLEALFPKADADHSGLKRVLDYYFDETAEVRKIIVRTARQIKKLHLPPLAPVAPPAPPMSWSGSRVVREKAPTVIKEGTSPKETGSRVNMYGYTTDLDAIRNGRGSLRLTKKSEMKDEDFEKQLASVSTAQAIQQQMAASSPLAVSQLHRPPSQADMMDWEEELRSTQVDIPKNAFSVKKIGRSSVILDERAMEKFKSIQAANGNAIEE